MEVRPFRSADALRETEEDFTHMETETGAEVVTAVHPTLGDVILIRNTGKSGRLPEHGLLITDLVRFLTPGDKPASKPGT